LATSLETLRVQEGGRVPHQAVLSLAPALMASLFAGTRSPPTCERPLKATYAALSQPMSRAIEEFLATMMAGACRRPAFRKPPEIRRRDAIAVL
jgi:hypothetical protein